MLGRPSNFTRDFATLVEIFAISYLNNEQLNATEEIGQ